MLLTNERLILLDEEDLILTWNLLEVTQEPGSRRLPDNAAVRNFPVLELEFPVILFVAVGVWPAFDPASWLPHET